MQVAMYYNNSDVRLEEMDIPKIGAGELLVKVMASGICGSDVMEWYRIKKAPLVLGHEIAGEVVEVGEGVEAENGGAGFSVGDRVMATHHVPCDECKYCLDGHHSTCDSLRSTKFYPGGFAQYLRLPAINVQKGTLKLPDSMSYDEATFIEPLACVVRGMRHARMKEGRAVLVLGAGISGLLNIKLARARGASRIIATDVSQYRLDAAVRSGADLALDAREDVPALVKEHNGGCLADLVIVCTGAKPAVEQAFNCVDRGGTILFFAPSDPDVRIPLNLWEAWCNELTFTTTYAGSPNDLREALALIESKQVEVTDIITHRLPLAKAQVGFGLVASAGESIKVIIRPQE